MTRNGVLPRVFLCILTIALPACREDGDTAPIAGEWDRIFTITAPELMQYGRAFAVDTIYYRYDLEGEAADPEAAFRAGLLEFSRGQTPDGFQAEQRALFYDSYAGFSQIKDGGVYPNRQTSVRVPADSSRFRFSGDPEKGFLLQDLRDEQSIVARPLAKVRDLQMGLARFELYVGAAELRVRGQRQPVVVEFERLFLPAANSFDEDAVRLWQSRARLFLTVASGAGGDLVLVREKNEVLRPLFITGSGATGDFAYLMRRPADSAGGAASTQPEYNAYPGRFEIQPMEAGAGFTGTFELTGADANTAGACEYELTAVHTTEFYTIARAQSRVASVRGKLVCPQRTYELQGLMRAWPE